MTFRHDPVPRHEAAVPPEWLAAGRDAPWRELSACVAGIGVSGMAAADVLLRLGAQVTVVDGRDGDTEHERAADLVSRGARVRLGDATGWPEGTQLVVTSPGWRPDAPLLVAAQAAGIPVWGEVELAWRLRPAGPDATAAPWLALTGTNGKTTTVRMLTAMLSAAGHHAVAAGNVGTPLLDAVLADPPYDVLAVELSSFQLHWADSVRPYAGALLNLAPDHLDWHGSMAAYAADKVRVWGGDGRAVFNADDPATVDLVADRPGAVGFTLGVPGPGQLGVSDDALVDRAFVRDPAGSPVTLAAIGDVQPAAPHNVANALAAAALARAYGVGPEAVAEGLRRFVPEPHRITVVAEADGVRWVDDSKATNTHAAESSIAAYERVVWVAGGLAKGASFDGLVRAAAGRLAGAVLLGADRAAVRDALARHAPAIPVREVTTTEDGAMTEVVRAAAALARPGDVVLLAPACASMDMFRDYGVRGDAFADAVRAHLGTGRPGGSR
ncbi:MAG: UDP-N-acetylmuramoyl-L-alanine--D-glutamate ligase [Actinomycetes bacterium]